VKRWLPILVALAPTYLIRFSIGGVPTTLLEILIYLTVVVAIGTGLNLTQYRSRMSLWARIFAVLVVIGGIVGVFVSADARQALGLFKGFIFDPILVAYLVLTTLDHDDLPQLLGWYAASAALVSVSSLIAWAAHAPWAVGEGGRLIGLYGIETNASPNYLAFWIAPAVALGIAWLVTPPWPLKRWERLLPVATAISAIALVGTASRGGLAAALVGGVLALGIYYRSSLAKLPYANGLGWLALIGLLALGMAFVQPDFSLSPGNGGRITSSNNIRWEIWKTTTELQGQGYRWLTGVGMADYQTRFSELTAHRVNYPEFISPWAATPHNLWLNAWTAEGLLGLVGVLGLTVLVLQTLWKTEPTVGATLVAAVVFAIFIQGLVDTPNWKNDTALLFWVMMIAVFVAASPRKRTGK